MLFGAARTRTLHGSPPSCAALIPTLHKTARTPADRSAGQRWLSGCATGACQTTVRLFRFAAGYPLGAQVRTP